MIVPDALPFHNEPGGELPRGARRNEVRGHGFDLPNDGAILLDDVGLQLVTLGFSFLDLPVWLAGFFTLVSGFGYVVDGIAQMHSKGHGDPKSWNEI